MYTHIHTPYYMYFHYEFLAEAEIFCRYRNGNSKEKQSQYRPGHALRILGG